jgi:signal peptidase I
VRVVAVGLVLAGCVTVSVQQPPSATASCSSGNELRAEQQSMLPTISPGDLLLVVAQSEYRRGEIVAFTPPPDWLSSGGSAFIKRVIAVAGETLTIDSVRGTVSINGAVLREPYLSPDTTTLASTDPATWTVGTGDLFVMGDNRASSADSRTFGPIPSSAVVGRVAWRCGPSPGPVN